MLILAIIAGDAFIGRRADIVLGAGGSPPTGGLFAAGSLADGTGGGRNGE